MFQVDTTNARIHIGPVGGDMVGTILVLGNKTTAGDPTAVEGAMYYNANPRKFRCYENGSWQDCARSARNSIYIYSDFTSGGSDTSIFSVNTGGSNSVTAIHSLAGRPGIWQQSTCTSATGAHYLGAQGLMVFCSATMTRMAMSHRYAYQPFRPALRHARIAADLLMTIMGPNRQMAAISAIATESTLANGRVSAAATLPKRFAIREY